MIKSGVEKSRNDRENREEKIRKRRDLFQRSVIPLLSWWCRYRLAFEYEKYDGPEVDGPLLICINHGCAYDPIFVGISFPGKRINYIASEHLVRTRAGKLLERYVSIIPHQKGSRSNRTALLALKKLRKGETVFLAPEGEQTWDGTPMPVLPYTGRLIKSSGATLVTYLIEGAYLTRPRWASNARKGKLTGRIAGIYRPAQLAEMSDEEVEALIKRDLSFNIWDWQRTRPGGPQRYRCGKALAEGLERAVVSCPGCGSIDTLRTKGDRISCSCGFSMRLLDTGFFAPQAPFETIPEWEEKDAVRITAILNENHSDAAEVFADDEVILKSIGEKHAEEEIAHGRISLVHKDEEYVICFREKEFPLKSISDMTMVLAGRIVFSIKKGYYEFSSKEANLRKYVIAWNAVKGS